MLDCSKINNYFFDPIQLHFAGVLFRYLNLKRRPFYNIRFKKTNGLKSNIPTRLILTIQSPIIPA